MIASLSHWLMKFVSLVEELSLNDVSTRLSKYLIDLSSKSGRSSERGIEFELDISKRQLASQLGTISETLSRALKKVRDREIIRRDREIIRGDREIIRRDREIIRRDREIIRGEGKKIIILQKEALEEIYSVTPQ